MSKSWVLVGVVGAVAASLDFAIFPHHHLGILYAIPLAIAAMFLPPLGVTATAAMAVGLDLLNIYVEKPPLDIAMVCFSAIVLVSYLAWRLSCQRVVLDRRTQDSETSRQQLQVFMGMVVHDLRGPLTVSRGYSQLLRRRLGGKDGDSVRSAIDGIDGGIDRMQRLVGDLHDATRLGASRFDIQPKTFDLSSLVRQVVEEQRSTSAEHDIDVKVSDRLVGCWDRERIGQVLTNLIGNAIKYSPMDAQIAVVARQAGPRIVITVSDHGQGIAPERVAELFRPFSRLDQHRRVAGTGLGLFITKGIVEAHGGRIWVESKLGEGSTFGVELPLDEPVSATVRQSADASSVYGADHSVHRQSA